MVREITERMLHYLGNADRYLPSVSNIIANLFKQALEGRFEAALTLALAAKPKALHGLKVINTQLILKAAKYAHPPKIGHFVKFHASEGG